MNFQNLPSIIGFGVKSYSILSKEKNIHIITGTHSDENKLLEKIKKLSKNQLSVHSVGMDRFNPKKISSLAHSIKSNRFSAIVAIGGGSIIDFSKLVIKEINELRKKSINFYVIPTLLGSGAESSMTAILNTKSEKKIYSDKEFLPDGIIYDFNLLKSINRERIVLGHLDALTHCLESLSSINKNPFSEFLAKTTMNNFINQFQKTDLFKNLDNFSLKEISILSLNGGICQNNSGAGITHALAHSLENRIKTPHIECISFFLKDVIDYLVKEDKNFFLSTDINLKKHFNKYTKEARKYESLQEIKKFLKNPKALDLIINDAKNDPCWRLFDKKINEEKLKKIIINNL